MAGDESLLRTFPVFNGDDGKFCIRVGSCCQDCCHTDPVASGWLGLYASLTGISRCCLQVLARDELPDNRPWSLVCVKTNLFNHSLLFYLQYIMSAHSPALDPEAFVQCPYEENHKIRNKRLQIHLVDCRKVSWLVLSSIAHYRNWVPGCNYAGTRTRFQP